MYLETMANLLKKYSGEDYLLSHTSCLLSIKNVVMKFTQYLKSGNVKKNTLLI